MKKDGHHTLLIAEFVKEATNWTIRRRIQAAATPVSLLQHRDLLNITNVVQTENHQATDVTISSTS